MKPMLCKLVSQAFDDDRYIWEIKYDGARCIARCGGGSHQLWSRSGREMTRAFPELDLRTKTPAVLDGELVCYQNGKSVFNGIQHRTTRENNVLWASGQYPATYEVFDIIEVGGIDLRGYSLTRRKEILNAILIPTTNVHIARVEDSGVKLYQEVEQKGLEGVIGKLKTGKYLPGKREWLKVKVPKWGEFVICGYTEGTGWRASTFGALILMVGHPNNCAYVGAVGTGFDDIEIARIDKRIKSLPVVPCPFGKEPEPATWIKPEIRCRVKFAEYTNDGKLRFPSYKGMTN